MSTPTFGPKPSVKARVGRLTSSVATVRKTKSGDTETLDSRTEAQTLDEYRYDGTGPHGHSGITIGFTLPGPRQSFATARVDVSVTLPHGPSAEESKKALAVCVHVVEKRLQLEAKELQKYLDALPSR